MAKRRATKQEIIQVRTALSVAFPACFAAKGGQKRPLKIGIRKDVMIEARALFPTISRRLIDAGLRDYCSGPNYLKVLVKGAARVDLQGNFAKFVTDDQAAHAQQCLRDRVKAKPATKASGGPKRVFDLVAPIADRAMRLAKLRAELEVLEASQLTAQMSDGFYYSNGRKARDDAAIAAVRAKLHELEEVAA